MKAAIKKAEMKGQFIDLQQFRGGRPVRLFRVCLRRCDVKRINVPYVVGRIGWFYSGKRLKPVDGIFVHCTDLKNRKLMRIALDSFTIGCILMEGMVLREDSTTSKRMFCVGDSRFLNLCKKL